MSDLKLFRIEKGTARELSGAAVALEKSLQDLLERNLDVFLGVRFLASEHSTGPKHGGRIDTLGLDENGSPVIIEYKRAMNENVINQGLFYLDWLMDHKGEFKLLVQEKLGKEAAAGIEWSVPRLLCIAGSFTKYDEHAVQQMHRNIELIRYRRFGEGLLILELVNATTGPAVADGVVSPSVSSRTISQTLAGLKGPLRDLYEELRAFLLAMGDDVQEKTLKNYVAFKRFKNFACVEVHPTKSVVSVYVKPSPEGVVAIEGLTRDVSNIGHFGTGDLEITLRSRADLDRARELFVKSYEVS